MPSFAALLTAALLTLSACRPNPLYCEDHVLHNCELPPATIDGQPGCISNEQCTASAVCNMSANICVQCTTDQAAACKGTTPVCGAANTCVQCTSAQPGTCTGTTPICNANSNQCGACTAHAQCATSAVCLADGSCASQADVAYVAPAPVGSNNPTCTKANPCTSLNTALQTSRRYIKLSGTTDEGATVSIIDQDVTLLGDPGAQLTTTKNGLLLEVRGSSHVVIYDLEVTGASGATGIGISIPAGSSGAVELHRGKVTNNVGGGISINGGSLTVSQSTISSNQSNGISITGGSLVISQSTISSNQGGGISITGGTFAIVSNVFYANGGINTSIGGIAISTPQNTVNRLEFNSFSRNQVQDGLGSAIQCAAGAMFTARNNIMSENGTLSNLEQLGGTCKHSYSVVRPGTLPPGTGNTSSDPAFVDAAKGDLHILPGSPARRAADPTSDLTGIASRDIDGDPRVAPADLGADQAK